MCHRLMWDEDSSRDMIDREEAMAWRIMILDIVEIMVKTDDVNKDIELHVSYSFKHRPKDGFGWQAGGRRIVTFTTRARVVGQKHPHYMYGDVEDVEQMVNHQACYCEECRYCTKKTTTEMRQGNTDVAWIFP